MAAGHKSNLESEQILHSLHSTLPTHHLLQLGLIYWLGDLRLCLHPMIILKKKICDLKTQLHVEREIWAKKSEFAEGSKSNLRIEQILRQLPRPLSADHHLPRSIPPQSGFVRLSLVFAFVTTSTTQRSVGCCQQYLLSSRK